MRDFHIKKIAQPSPHEGTDLRGFNILKNAKISRINGIILTEQVHPQLKDTFEELKKCSQKDNSISFDKIIEIDEDLKKEYN